MVLFCAYWFLQQLEKSLITKFPWSSSTDTWWTYDAKTDSWSVPWCQQPAVSSATALVIYITVYQLSECHLCIQCFAYVITKPHNSKLESIRARNHIKVFQGEGPSLPTSPLSYAVEWFSCKVHESRGLRVVFVFIRETNNSCTQTDMNLPVGREKPFPYWFTSAWVGGI